MAADFNKPVVTDAYASVLQSIRDLAKDLALCLDNTGTQNIPTNAIRWSSANNRFEKYNGTTWAALTGQYAIDVATVGGKSVGNASGNVPLSNGTLNTNLNADMVDGLHAAVLVPAKSLRDFTLGTLITTSIDYSVTNGDAWVFEISGNSYGESTPFNIQLQGYIYSGSVINYGGMKLGPAPSQFVILNNGGYLCLWMPRLSYWNGFSVTAYIATTPGAKVNAVTSITDSAQPAGATKVVDISSTVKTAWHSGNFDAASLTASALANIGSPGTYGGVNIKGANAGWAGFRFNSGARYFMSDGTTTGEYHDGVGWMWRWDSGTLTNGTVPWARLSGVPSFNYLPTAGGSLTGLVTTVGNTAAFNSANDQTLSVRSGGASYPAVMSFHRPGAYAINVGLDTDNYFKIGGWSAGSAVFQLNMSGQLWLSNYGWLHDYFFSGVTNCAYTVQRGNGNTGNCVPGNPINCYGSGNLQTQVAELLDNGSSVQLRAVNYNYNCNCNCDCTC